MSRFLNRWIGSRKLGQRAETSGRPGRKRRTTRRGLKPETLESRQLLAANIFHNDLMPEDVNEDGLVSAIDALTIINQIGRQTPTADADGWWTRTRTRSYDGR